MTFKIRLIKHKIQNTFFYKTSEIKFHSLSTSTISKFRMRSTEKIIKFKNPWMQLNTHQISQLTERLEDKPGDLYELVKQNINLKKLKKNLKSDNINLLSTTTLPKPNQVLNKRIQQKTLSILNSADYKKVQKILKKSTFIKQDKFSQSKLLQRIQQKRKQYEQQMNNLRKYKKLVLETDIQKINKIKLILENVQTRKTPKMPLWKLR